MQWESLTNELLLGLVESFHVVHLCKAFYGRNSRFDQLLCIQYQRFHLDFRSISKHDFDNISPQLPFIIDRIISLHFSNENRIPNLSNPFISRGFTIDRFLTLQSLSFYDISSVDIVKQQSIWLICISMDMNGKNFLWIICTEY